MNPIAGEPPLRPAGQPPRSSFSCDRHPHEKFTGFCPECLCERLTGLDDHLDSAPRKSNAASSSAALAAVKAIFRGDKAGNRNGASGKPPTSFLAELRRTKSFSASKGEAFSGGFEPQRRSCDVRVRNSNWSLFSQNDERRIPKKETLICDAEIETKCPALESKEAVLDGSECQEEVEDEREAAENVCRDDADAVGSGFEDEIVEEKPVGGGSGSLGEEEFRPMKDHLDLDFQGKKPPPGRDFKEIAGSFWSAASVFSKKLQIWRKKQKLKKRGNRSALAAMLPVEKPSRQRYRETQSEIADYGFGRRSCDTDPRFSLDAGRVSLERGRNSSDDPRYSFDEPRASWDGYLIGRALPRQPPMGSVLEDAPVHVPRTDNQIPVEAPLNPGVEDDAVPGGSAQTREYYSDSSSRRKKSLDRSGSTRKAAPTDDAKPVPNPRVSPTAVDPLRGDCSEAFETGSVDAGSVTGGAINGDPKRGRKWKAWSLWSLINKRGGGGKEEVEDRLRKLAEVERSWSETWQREGGNPRVGRSNSSVGWRSSGHANGGGSVWGGRKGCGVLERNRSAGHSCSGSSEPIGNGGAGGRCLQPPHSHSIARSLLRLY